MTADGLRAQVADASRILAGLGVNDAFGHVSVRSAPGAGTFLIPRALAPALVTPADVVELDLEGACAGDQPPRLFLERFIHSEIYRLRPDVMAVVHSHSPEVVPFTVVPGASVRPICHVCGFLRGTRGPFDVADHAGQSSDLLIRDSGLGRALAAHLAETAVVLMRGHGFTAVGASLPEATYRAAYTVRNCQIELRARSLGDPVFLTDGEAAACDATTAAQAGRAWELWRHQFATADAAAHGSSQVMRGIGGALDA